MIERQRGFSVVELLAIIVGIAVIISVGLYVYNRQYPILGSGIKTNNASLYLFSSNTGGKHQTYLNVDFKDSVITAGCSSAVVSGFQGKVQFSHNDTGASLSITQNKRPPKQTSDGGICTGTQEAHPSADVTKKVSFSQQWIENKSATKAITINKEDWKLTLHRAAYSLEFSGPEGQRSLQSYLPPDVAELSMPSSCMTNAQWASYITGHGIETAEQKYPGIDNAYLKLHPDYNSANRDTLVIVNQYVKSLPQNSYNCNEVQLIDDPASSGGLMGPIALPLHKDK